MNKLIFDKEEVNLLIDKLSANNIEIIKSAAQRLTDESSRGRFLLKSDQLNIVNRLNGILQNFEFATIYKWIYKCLCYYNNDESEKILLKNFLVEKDSESRVWIISAISSRYCDEKELMKVLYQLKEQTGAKELDKEKLFYATSLFSKLPIRKMPADLPKKIINNNDYAGMLWLAKIYAFPIQARRRGLGELVKDFTIDELTFSSNEQLQLYAHWSLVSHDSYHLLSLDDVNRKKLNVDVLKWYYHGIIVGQYYKHNYEFIYEMIFQCIYNYSGVFRIKQGVINALLLLEYNRFFDDAMVQWFYSENSEEIKLSLLEYFVKNVLFNSSVENVTYGTFYEILKEAYDNSTLRNYIFYFVKVYKTLKICMDTLEVNKMIKGEGNMEKNEQIIIIGNIGDKNQIGGKNNMLMTGDEQNAKMKELLQRFIDVCPDMDLREECKDVRESASNSDNIRDKVLALVSHLASWLTVATTTPTVISAANELIKYLTSIF